MTERRDDGNGRQFQGETGARLAALDQQYGLCIAHMARIDSRIRACEQMDICGKRWHDMETRVRTLESFRWGALALTGLLQGIGIAVIVQLIRSM